jgi:hypothetical protein
MLKKSSSPGEPLEHSPMTKRAAGVMAEAAKNLPRSEVEEPVKALIDGDGYGMRAELASEFPQDHKLRRYHYEHFLHESSLRPCYVRERTDEREATLTLS